MSGPSFPDDWDQDAEMAAYLADIEAGLLAEPGPWSSPSCTVSLGEAADVDAAVLGAGGAAFAEGRAGDGLAPGPVLAALTEQAAEDLPALSDDELLGQRGQHRAGCQPVPRVALGEPETVKAGRVHVRGLTQAHRAPRRLQRPRLRQQARLDIGQVGGHLRVLIPVIGERGSGHRRPPFWSGTWLTSYEDYTIYR